MTEADKRKEAFLALQKEHEDMKEIQALPQRESDVESVFDNYNFE